MKTMRWGWVLVTLYTGPFGIIAMRVRWAGSTYGDGIFAPLLLRIDHIFESRNWCAESSDTYPITGSDHQGVASTVGPCPGNARPIPATPPPSDGATSSV